jgi:hypothetical protein
VEHARRNRVRRPGFLYVMSQATGQAEAAQVQARAYAIRGWTFLGFIVPGVGVTAATLAPFPIPALGLGNHQRRASVAIGRHVARESTVLLCVSSRHAWRARRALRQGRE